ncbi:hypothetical protein [Albibacterium profundi]|uniref:Uncharacterized protein n=1 Tax=Albibacterium profundi TaxID=3134906 RepID=A0ABV5CES4_9SPHI
MKITTLLLITLSTICQAQPVIDIDTKGHIQDRFVAKYNPEYALFNHLGAGLIHKEGQWTLVRVWDEQVLGLSEGMKKEMKLLEHLIADNLAHQILTELAPETLFSIGQDRLDKLPESCKGEPGKKQGIAGRISDAATITIWGYSSGTQKKIQFYAADFYYNTCYPYQPEFKILEPLLNTFEVLEKYVNEVGNAEDREVAHRNLYR